MFPEFLWDKNILLKFESIIIQTTKQFRPKRSYLIEERACYKAEKQRTSITLIRFIFIHVWIKYAKICFYSLLIFLRPNSPVSTRKHVLLLCNTWLYNKICINQISTMFVWQQQNTTLPNIKIGGDFVKNQLITIYPENINISAFNIFHKLLIYWKVAFKDHKIVLTLKLSK